jgi:hypothetical protein
VGAGWGWGWLALLVGWAAIVVWRRSQDDRVRSSEQTPQTPGAVQGSSGQSPEDDIDREELEQAEQDVKDMQQDVRGRPVDDVVGDDWGPGTPKPPYV